MLKESLQYYSDPVNNLLSHLSIKSIQVKPFLFATETLFIKNQDWNTVSLKPFVYFVAIFMNSYVYKANGQM